MQGSVTFSLKWPLESDFQGSNQKRDVCLGGSAFRLRTCRLTPINPKCPRNGIGIELRQKIARGAVKSETTYELLLCPLFSMFR